MEIPSQMQWMCIPCGQKYGYRIGGSPTWHFSTCAKCRQKDVVTEQRKNG